MSTRYAICPLVCVGVGGASQPVGSWTGRFQRNAECPLRGLLRSPGVAVRVCDMGSVSVSNRPCGAPEGSAAGCGFACAEWRARLLRASALRVSVGR